MKRVMVLMALLSLPAQLIVAGALTLEELPLVALMKSSDYVARGRVGGSVATDREDWPEVLTRFNVGDVYKGSAVPAQLELSAEGMLGEGDVPYYRECEAPLSAGDEVVLFLRHLDTGDVVVTGGVQGAFFVVDAGDRGMVVRCTTGRIPLAHVAPEERPVEMPLNEFLEYLDELATYLQ